LYFCQAYHANDIKKTINTQDNTTNRQMKRFNHTVLLLLTFAVAHAQENVTTRYVENPSFEARFAGWTNSDFCFSINDNFTRKNGIVYMQRQATSGNKIKNADIHQSLIDLPTGTYTLTADCQLI